MVYLLWWIYRKVGTVMDKEQVKIIIKNLIDLSNFDRDDLHELSKYADQIIVNKFIRNK